MTPEAQEALLALYDAMSAGVARVARREGCGEEEVEEATQETWLTLTRLWPRIHATYPADTWEGYVVRVAQSRARDVLRAVRFRGAHVGPYVADDAGRAGRDVDLGDEERASLADVRPSPETIAEAREAWGVLLAECRSDAETVMLTLRGEAFTHDEIAWILAEMGVGVYSANAVSLALSRLRARAAAALAS